MSYNLSYRWMDGWMVREANGYNVGNFSMICYYTITCSMKHIKSEIYEQIHR